MVTHTSVNGLDTYKRLAQNFGESKSRIFINTAGGGTSNYAFKVLK